MADAGEPGARVVVLMREHLAGVHGVELDLGQDVEWPGHPRVPAWMVFEPANAARSARFRCMACLGELFAVGGPVEGPARDELLVRQHPELRALLHGVPVEARAAVIRAWDRGELGQRTAAEVVRAATRRQARRQDPAAARRKQGCRAWMLEAYGRLPRVEDVIDELAELLETREGQREILGAERHLSPETLRNYWKEIPRPERDAAKARWVARPEPEQRMLTAGHRTRHRPR